jgi:hypothetical protein
MAETTNLQNRLVVRGSTTWYCYLLFGFFTYLLNIQGNVVPFLKSELDLSFWAVSLHSSAVAVGLIAVGLLGDWVRRRIGRPNALRLAVGGMATGAVLLCLARASWASIAMLRNPRLFRRPNTVNCFCNPGRHSPRRTRHRFRRGDCDILCLRHTRASDDRPLPMVCSRLALCCGWRCRLWRPRPAAISTAFSPCVGVRRRVPAWAIARSLLGLLVPWRRRDCVRILHLVVGSDISRAGNQVSSRLGCRDSCWIFSWHATRPVCHELSGPLGSGWVRFHVGSSDHARWVRSLLGLQSTGGRSARHFRPRPRHWAALPAYARFRDRRSASGDRRCECAFHACGRCRHSPRSDYSRTPGGRSGTSGGAPHGACTSRDCARLLPYCPSNATKDEGANAVGRWP